MSRFKPYKIHKYASAYEGSHGTIYPKEPGSYAELCSECGFPLGEHSGLDHCPGTNGFIHTPRMDPVFLRDEMNKLTRTI